MQYGRGQRWLCCVGGCVVRCVWDAPPASTCDRRRKDETVTGDSSRFVFRSDSATTLFFCRCPQKPWPKQWRLATIFLARASGGTHGVTLSTVVNPDFSTPTTTWRSTKMTYLILFSVPGVFRHTHTWSVDATTHENVCLPWKQGCYKPYTDSF